MNMSIGFSPLGAQILNPCCFTQKSPSCFSCFVLFVTFLAPPSVLRPPSVLSPPWRVQPGETPLQDCPAPGRRPRVQPGETPLQDCPAPGRRPSVLCLHPRFPLLQRVLLHHSSLITHHSSFLCPPPSVLRPLSSALSPSCSFFAASREPKGLDNSARS